MEDVLVHNVVFAAGSVIEGDVFVGDQHQVLDHDTRSFFDGVFGMDGSVRFHLNGQLFVVGTLPYPRVLNAIRHIFDRGIDGINRNYADGCIFRQVVVGRNVATALGDG